MKKNIRKPAVRRVDLEPNDRKGGHGMYLYVRGPRNEIHMDQVHPTTYNREFANGMPVLIDGDELLVRLWRVVGMLGGEGADENIIRKHRNLQDEMHLKVAADLQITFGMSGNYFHVYACGVSGLGDSAVEAMVAWAREMKKKGVDYPPGWEY